MSMYEKIKKAFGRRTEAKSGRTAMAVSTPAASTPKPSQKASAPVKPEIRTTPARPAAEPKVRTERPAAPATAAAAVGPSGDQADGLRRAVTGSTAVAEERPRPQPEPTGREVAPRPVRDGALDAPAPRNKQELFEDLQRNYREVVQLVRKVDAHLDRESERADRLMNVAERVDAALPEIQRLSGETGAKLDTLREEIVKAIRDADASGVERSSKLERAVQSVGVELEKTGKSQGKLVTTMAEFRETLGDLSQSNKASGDAITRLTESAERRDKELMTKLGQTRSWLVGAIVGIGAVAALAVVLAIVAISSSGASPAG